MRRICRRAWPLLLAVFASALHAQTLRGVVVDSASRQPIPGAVVTLFTADRRELGRVITSASGRFSLASPGVVAARVVRLGFRPREVDVSTSANQPIEVALSPVSQLLAPVRVDDDSPCPRHPDNLAAIGLWAQAQSGLLAAVVARQTLPATMMNLSFKRLIEGNSDRFQDQEVRIHQGTAASSFRATPSVSELERTGFVKNTADGDLFFGPDAELLLDDAFMRNYCLSLAPADKARASAVGVNFARARRMRDRVDISGTIWIDTAHRTLDRITFRYDGLDPEIDRFRTGGELVFHDIRPGTPQIQRWSIRTVAERTPSMGGPAARLRHFEVHEDGGELARAEWTDGTLWRAPLGRARIRATTSRGEKAIGVVLSLVGTDYVATTDSTGTAEFADLLPGPYHVVVIDTALAIVGATGETHTRFVAARDSIREVSSIVPSAAEQVEAACRRDALWTPGSYALVVQVANSDATPVAGARWSLSVGRTTGVTGSNGVFQYCFGLDLGTTVQIHVSRNGEAPTTVTRTLSRKLTAVRLEVPR